MSNLQRQEARPRKRVVVQVPATTANLGPGFDIMGMALDIYNQAVVEESDAFRITISGEGAEVISRGKDNLVYKGIEAVCQKTGRSLPPLSLSCYNDIPLARGLGSSAAAVVAGLTAANSLGDNPLSVEELLEIGAEIEGHPDNITPALLGGCQIVVRDGHHLVHMAIPLPPNLKAVLFIPDFPMPTQESRSILPHQVSRADAVYNLGRVALLVTALFAQQLHYLRIATEDRLHQPARQALFPALGSLLEAALAAGAHGAFLSGSGSTVLALTSNDAQAVGEKMQAVAEEWGVRGKIRVAHPTPRGAQISKG